MAILRPLNEFICEPVVLALEPSRKCVASCTYCFALLNARMQKNNRSKNEQDDGSFERTLTKAMSPSYDPTNFLQWGLHNRLVLGYANTVEPFQDITQARNLLSMLNQFDIPLFIQTKGVNFNAVSDLLLPFHDNSSVFVSIPSLDDRYVKRFEPGTPPVAERLAMIDWLADHDFWVIAALSPYHEQFCSDPEALVNTLTDHGVNEIFFDRLHLNQRQYDYASEHGDKLMASIAGGRNKPWPPEANESFRLIYNQSIANELDFFASGFDGLVYGHANTLPSISPVEVYTRGNSWPYYDGFIFHILEQTFYNPDITPLNRDMNDSILVTWRDCLELMELNGVIDQPFDYSSLTDIIHIYRYISDAWKASIGKLAPIREYYRALFNSPRRNQFFWRHPYIRIAANMDGTPILDDDGNLQGLFDPDYTGSYKRHFRLVSSLDGFRTLEKTFVSD